MGRIILGCGVSSSDGNDSVKSGSVAPVVNISVLIHAETRSYRGGATGG